MAKKKPAVPEERDLRKRALNISDCLARHYPDTGTALVFATPFQLLIATILSAQCTDEKVNQTTPGLFAKYATPQAFAEMELPALEQMIYSTGFYRQKARSIQNCSRALVENHGGKVPESMEALTALPGVGRKTANLVRACAMGYPGLIVDTHFKRVVGRMGLTRQTHPDKIEQDIARLLPEERWTAFSDGLIWHGRRICQARTPKCNQCPVFPDCVYGQAQNIKPKP